MMYKYIILSIVLLFTFSCKNNTEVKNDQKETIVKHDRFTKKKATMDYIAIGKKFAMTAKKVLGTKLMMQIKNNGTSNALSFCSVQAIPLLDSISKANYVQISRVTDKPRNIDNQANELELSYIDKYHKLKADGKPLTPTQVTNDQNVTTYYPIPTNGLCLQCHGNINQDIKPEVLKNINNIYPKDIATGYKSNQIRGLWKIVMNSSGASIVE